MWTVWRTKQHWLDFTFSLLFNQQTSVLAFNISQIKIQSLHFQNNSNLIITVIQLISLIHFTSLIHFNSLIHKSFKYDQFVFIESQKQCIHFTELIHFISSIHFNWLHSFTSRHSFISLHLLIYHIHFNSLIHLAYSSHYIHSLHFT